MLTYIRSNKPNIMPHNKDVFQLRTKPVHQGERGEVINKCRAYSLTEAIMIFAEIKRLTPNELVKLFHVK